MELQKTEKPMPCEPRKLYTDMSPTPKPTKGNGHDYFILFSFPGQEKGNVMENLGFILKTWVVAIIVLFVVCCYEDTGHEPTPGKVWEWVTAPAEETPVDGNLFAGSEW